MEVEVFGHPNNLSEDEKRLIEKAKKALSPIQYLIMENASYGSIFQRVDAIVWQTPLRLDFRAHTPGEIGQAFIAPECGYPLTEDLFDGERMTPAFLTKLKSDVEAWKEFMREG